MVILFISSCASTVETIKDDKKAILSENMGYALIPVSRNTNIHQIRIAGTKYFQLDSTDLKYNKNYLLIALPQGQYTYDEIRLNKYTIIDNFSNDEGIWDFTIQAGVINYVGHFNVKNHSKMWGTYSLTYEIQNNASVALEYLEKNYPLITKQYQVVYGGPGDDDFFNYVSAISSTQGEK